LQIPPFWQGDSAQGDVQVIPVEAWILRYQVAVLVMRAPEHEAVAMPMHCLVREARLQKTDDWLCSMV
jgi:hypothetical protein